MLMATGRRIEVQSVVPVAITGRQGFKSASTFSLLESVLNWRAKWPQSNESMLRSLLRDGVSRHAGLSEVSVADIQAASRLFKVATVQNRYNLIVRDSEDVLAYCERHGIGFIPWFPLAAGDLAKPGSLLDAIAKRHRATPSQIALAWVLKRSPVMLPIPGTSKVPHLEENVASVNVVLSDEEFAALDREGKALSGR